MLSILCPLIWMWVTYPGMPVRGNNGYLVGQQYIQRILGSVGFHLRTSVAKFTSLSIYEVSWLLRDTGPCSRSFPLGSGFVLHWEKAVLL